MSDSPVRDLYATVAQDPDLQHRFRSAQNPSELREAVIAAGFDPDDPEISTALESVGEMSDADLAATAGGFGGDAGDEDLGPWF